MEIGQELRGFMEVWNDQADACLLLDAALDIIWRSSVVRENFPTLIPGVNILDYGDNVLSCMVKSNLWEERGIAVRCTISGTDCFLSLCEMPGKDRLFLCRLRSQLPYILLPEATLKDLTAYEQPTAGVFAGLYDRLMALQDENLYNASVEKCLIDCVADAADVSRFAAISSEYRMLQKGTLPHLIRKVNLTEYLTIIFQSSVELLQGVNLDLAYHYNQPLIVSTEPLYLLRILGELFSNALKYHLGVNSMIKVWYELHDDAADIYVENIGTVSEEVSARMYDPFFSTYRTDENSFHGHGLGLSVAEKYADFIGGKLTLTECINKTIFKLSFPFLNGSENECECDICETDICAQLRLLLSDLIATRIYTVYEALRYHRKE